MHWRPAKYWAKGTTIKVSVNALGVHLGDGVYGSSNAKTHFTIGRQLRAVCDNTTHRTKVYIDGKMVRNMACSNGRGGYTTGAKGQQIHFWTQNGPHVVLSKEKTHSMSSASYGLTDPNNPYYYAPEDVKLLHPDLLLGRVPARRAVEPFAGPGEHLARLRQPERRRRQVGLRQLHDRRRRRGQSQPETPADQRRPGRLDGLLRPVRQLSCFVV